MSNKELINLKKYSFGKSNLLLEICKDVEGKHCIRPISWSGVYKNGLLLEGNCLVKFDTRKEAEDTLINICGYSKRFIVSQE